MAQTKAQNVDELADAVRKAAKRFSATAVAALAANPTAVASALAATASTLGATNSDVAKTESVGDAKSALLDEAEAQRRLDARTRKGRETDLLTSDELAKRTGLKTRQSVHGWLKKGRVLGWEGAKRGVVFPAGQLDTRGRPLAGIERIAAHFPDGYAAWVWLTTPLNALDGATPLSLLRDGDVEGVVAAAQGDAQGDFA